MHLCIFFFSAPQQSAQSVSSISRVNIVCKKVNIDCTLSICKNSCSPQRICRNGAQPVAQHVIISCGLGIRMNNNYQFWFRMNNSGTRSSTGESSKRSLAGPAVANGSLSPLQSHMFQSVSKFSSSSFREIRNMVGKLVSFSKNFVFVFYCTTSQLWALACSSSAPVLRAWGSGCLQILMASHVSLDTAVRGIFSLSSICIYVRAAISVRRTKF